MTFPSTPSLTVNRGRVIPYRTCLLSDITVRRMVSDKLTDTQCDDEDHVRRTPPLKVKDEEDIKGDKA